MTEHARIAEAERVAGHWFPFVRGETPLDFGAKYLFISAKREAGIFWSHEAPASDAPMLARTV